MLPIYKRIRELRIENDLSQNDLAKLVGYTNRSSIARIEAGDVDLSQSKIVQFADVLHTTPAYLMGWVDDPTNYGYKGFDKRKGPPQSDGPEGKYDRLNPTNRAIVDSLIDQLLKSQSETLQGAGSQVSADHKHL